MMNASVFPEPVGAEIIELFPFNIERIDYENNKIIDYADTEVDYDLLVTVPTNMGDELIERSGMGDDLNFVPTHHNTLQSLDHENVFVIGDATNVPASKAGSVAHFEAEILTENIQRYIDGKELKEEFERSPKGEPLVGKSAIFGEIFSSGQSSPSISSRIFPGFKSQCSTPLECA